GHVTGPAARGSARRGAARGQADRDLQRSQHGAALIGPYLVTGFDDDVQHLPGHRRAHLAVERGAPARRGGSRARLDQPTATRRYQLPAGADTNNRALVRTSLTAELDRALPAAALVAVEGERGRRHGAIRAGQ